MGSAPPVTSSAGAASGSKPRVKATARLSHLKFMQKAAAKSKPAVDRNAPADAVTESKDATIPGQGDDTEQWSTAGGRISEGCRVITEDAPPPGALLGRLSFGSFNPSIEALQAASETAQVAAAAAETAKPSTDTSSTISDAAMAASLGRSQGSHVDENNIVADGPIAGTSRADAAKNEAMASMSGVVTGRDHTRTNDDTLDSNGLMSLTPTASKPVNEHPRQKKKQGRGLREGEEDIAPLRQPKRKKHGR